ncbi:pilus assembly protein N-terminal domain-containing protein [Enterovibrio makurazakiensis]|uniref:Pilus assembly protein N-terminal domain-containing protein n=1 Tax=Enterovibrio gelatinilyticus TaxID=2899819 RepID=A0ABT5R3S3_9GAMM|nr:pilus assembly protein N-terminal domain-containing protein [Enterovibrio sp. ZSDZ42]MDD1794654.1 pilus assembly protein N-terminal domain-containing protein [Enterovibrio sp. ZSDZ42]
MLTLRFHHILLVVFLASASLTVKAAGIINLGTGDARSMHFDTTIGTIFIANPEVADYQVIDNNRLVVFGRNIGTTTLIVFGENSSTLTEKRIVVNKSLISIEQMLSSQYPNAEVSVLNLGDRVVLGGTVPTQKEKDEIYAMVGELLTKDPTEKVKTLVSINTDTPDKDIDYLAHKIYEGVVNNLEVTVTKQVNVKLTIAEVNSSIVNELGIQWGTVFENTFNNGQFFRAITGTGGSGSNVGSYISAINDDRIGQVLSEPNLSVISGETASFLVGGEVPISYLSPDGYVISYRSFGIGLELAAEVQRDDKIMLTLLPSVSSVDEQFGETALDIPAFRVRRAQTTIELGDGDSFVLAGLLSTEDQESLAKIPFIADVPILGALFRHSTTTRRKTELVIVATVSLVTPITSANITLPQIKQTSTLSRFFGVDFDSSSDTAKWQTEILATGGFKK